MRVTSVSTCICVVLGWNWTVDAQKTAFEIGQTNTEDARNNLINLNSVQALLAFLVLPDYNASVGRRRRNRGPGKLD